MMPLTLADTGATYTILKVGGKPEVRAHLNDLGFVAGGDVQVITDMMGNLIVNVKETRGGHQQRNGRQDHGIRSRAICFVYNFSYR